MLTTFFFTKDEVSLVDAYLKALIELGVCGIAIKEIFYQEISHEIWELANQKGVPIFFYSKDVCAEDIIAEIKEIINMSQHDRQLEPLIQALMKDACTEKEEQILLKQINPNFYS